MSRPPRENRSRRRRAGIGGSIVVHVLFVLLFILLAPLFPKPQIETQSSSTEVVTVTHRPKVRPAAAPQAEAVPTAQPAKALRAAAQPPPRRALRRPAPAAVPHVATAPVIPKIVHHSPARPAPVALAPKAPAASQSRSARAGYSQSQIERIQNDLAQSIASQRNGIAPLAVGTSEAAPAMKRYGPAIAAFDVGDERTHHGLCDPIKQWNAEGYDYYFVSCNVRFSDGTFQRESVPWPVRFDPKNDPFSGTAGRDLPLAMPLPGWHVEPGVYVSKELREYAHDHGIDI